MTDQEQLERLRVRVAKIAQAIGVESQGCRVLGKDDTRLAHFAKVGNADWFGLADAIVTRIADAHIAGEVMAGQLELVARDLREVVPKTGAWSDIILTTERQARNGRQYFPQSQSLSVSATTTTQS